MDCKCAAVPMAMPSADASLGCWATHQAQRLLSPVEMQHLLQHLQGGSDVFWELYGVIYVGLDVFLRLVLCSDGKVNNLATFGVAF